MKPRYIFVMSSHIYSYIRWLQPPTCCAFCVFPHFCLVRFFHFGVASSSLFVLLFLPVCSFYPSLFSFSLATYIPCTSSSLPHFTPGKSFLASPEFPSSLQ